MAEKRAWLTDPETGEKFHAWSHVKSIFYNKATNILLKDKLDEMDKLIDEKIKKAMMSNIQLNDQNKVPTSALAYNMQQLINKNADDITKLNSDLRNNWAGVVSIIPKITADSTGTWASGTANITQSGLLRISGNTNGEYGMVKLSINNQEVLGYQNSAGLYTFSYRVRKGDIVGVSVVNTANVEASLLTL